MSLFTHGGKVFSPNGKVDVDPADADRINRERSLQEAGRFQGRQLGNKIFAYWKDGQPAQITTWMGDVLADVTWQGHPYNTPGFGRSSERVNFRAKGIDGRLWSGTYYKSSGDYVRMRATPR